MALNRNNERMREVEVYRHDPPAPFVYHGPHSFLEAHDRFCWDMHMNIYEEPVITEVVKCVLAELTAPPGQGVCAIVEPEPPQIAIIPEPAPVHAPPPLQQRGLHGPMGRATIILRNDSPPDLTGRESSEHLRTLRSIGFQLFQEISDDERHQRYAGREIRTRWEYFFEYSNSILRGRND